MSSLPHLGCGVLTAVASPTGASGSSAGGAGSTQGAPNANGGSDPSSFPSGPQPQQLNGQNGAVGMHTGGLPFAPSSVLPARPNLPDDPVIPHNGFATVEEGEKAFVHLLRKAGVDANWTWDQTMRAIITDPLYKALNTLAEKKAAWQKVRRLVTIFFARTSWRTPVRGWSSRQGAGRTGGSFGQAPAIATQHAERQPQRVPLHDICYGGQALCATSDLAAGEG